MFGNKFAMQHINIALAAQGFEITVGKEVNIGGVVPFVRQLLGHRHTPAKRQIGSGAPAAEVGEGNNALIADSKHLIQHQMGMAHSLQCLSHDYRVKALVGKVIETIVEVLFNNIDPPGNTVFD